MPFPLEVAGRTLADPPALAAAFAEDAAAGRPPVPWVMELVGAAIDRELAVGLSAAMLRARAPAAVAEGARLAVALGDARLGELTRLALAAHDVGLLLHPDPCAPDGGSVEDALLDASVRLTDLADPTLRAELLERLRHAGLRDLELDVLAAHGDADEIRRLLPAVLAEAAPEGLDAAVARIRARELDDAVDAALAEVS